MLVNPHECHRIKSVIHEEMTLVSQQNSFRGLGGKAGDVGPYLVVPGAL